MVENLTGQGFAQIVGFSAYAATRAQDTLDGINVFPVADAGTGADLLQQLHNRFVQQQDIPRMEAGAVLATHTGLGAVAVAVRRLPGESRRKGVLMRNEGAARARPHERIDT